MEGRTVEQCLRRYDELCNGGRPGKMTTEEDVVCFNYIVISDLLISFLLSSFLN